MPSSVIFWFEADLNRIAVHDSGSRSEIAEKDEPTLRMNDSKRQLHKSEHTYATVS